MPVSLYHDSSSSGSSFSETTGYECIQIQCTNMLLLSLYSWEEGRD